MNYTIRGNLPKQSDDYVRDVLLARGIQDPARYKRPTASDQHDPYLIPNMAEGVELLAKHIAKKSKIFLQVD